MLDIDLRSIDDRKYGGKFSIEEVRYGHGSFVVVLKPSVESRSDGQKDVRDWQTAHLKFPIQVLSKIVDAIVADYFNNSGNTQPKRGMFDFKGKE